MFGFALALGVIFLLELMGKATSLNSTEEYWNYKYTVNVSIKGQIATASVATATACASLCTAHASCLSYGYSPDHKGCWLYDHLVEYTTQGKTAPGTRYFFRLPTRCPADLGYGLQLGLCYRVTPNTMTWDEGSTLCRKEGAHLFIADSREKVNLLLIYGDLIWIGASDVDVQGDWRWVDGQKLPSDSPLWGPGYPDNYLGGQHVLELKPTGGLNDMFSTMLRRVACQVPLA